LLWRAVIIAVAAFVAIITIIADVALHGRVSGAAFVNIMRGADRHYRVRLGGRSPLPVT